MKACFDKDMNFTDVELHQLEEAIITSNFESTCQGYEQAQAKLMEAFELLKRHKMRMWVTDEFRCSYEWGIMYLINDSPNGQSEY
jgi:hypothetical protein